MRYSEKADVISRISGSGATLDVSKAGKIQVEIFRIVTPCTNVSEDLNVSIFRFSPEDRDLCDIFNKVYSLIEK
jgi:hypothetical protein